MLLVSFPKSIPGTRVGLEYPHKAAALTCAGFNQGIVCVTSVTGGGHHPRTTAEGATDPGPDPDPTHLVSSHRLKEWIGLGWEGH